MVWRLLGVIWGLAGVVGAVRLDGSPKRGSYSPHSLWEKAPMNGSLFLGGEACYRTYLQSPTRNKFNKASNYRYLKTMSSPCMSYVNAMGSRAILRMEGIVLLPLLNSINGSMSFGSARNVDRSSYGV